MLAAGRPAVDVHRADDGLEGVGQDRGLVPAAGHLLAAAEPHVGAEVELAGHPGQGPHLDYRGPQLGQLPFGQVRVVAEQGVGHDQAEDGVAEELQPLVRRGVVVLVGEGAVGQSTFERRGRNGHAESAASSAGSFPALTPPSQDRLMTPNAPSS